MKRKKPSGDLVTVLHSEDETDAEFFPAVSFDECDEPEVTQEGDSFLSGAVPRKSSTEGNSESTLHPLLRERTAAFGEVRDKLTGPVHVASMKYFLPLYQERGPSDSGFHSDNDMTLLSERRISNSESSWSNTPRVPPHTGREYDGELLLPRFDNLSPMSSLSGQPTDSPPARPPKPKLRLRLQSETPPTPPPNETLTRRKKKGLCERIRGAFCS